MGRSKDLFLRLLEEMLYNDPLEEALYQEDKRRRESGNYIHENFEISKGDYKTTVEILFTKDGYPVGVKVNSENINKEKLPENEFQAQLNEALEKEDDEAADRIQKEMKAYNSL